MKKTAPTTTEKPAGKPTPSTKKKAGSRKTKPAPLGTGKTLVIVESPAKAKTIHKYLGKDSIIEASMGHIVDLPKSRLAVDVANNYEPEYITVRGRAGLLNKLKKISANAKTILLAADPDREGEAISWHLRNALIGINPNIKRVVFNEITRDAVVEAVKNPRDINMALVNAQQGRRVLDRLVGYNVSPVLWKKVKKGLSAGRVQSVALRLICDRETEIEAFVPTEYWSLEVDLKTANKDKLEAALVKIAGEKAEISSEGQVMGIIADLDKNPFVVQGVTNRERQRKPTAPYTTSKMQQDASNKLGFTSQKTMSIAQQLYEGIELGGETTGLITYMRTDSTRISDAALGQLRGYIAEQYGPSYLPPQANIYSMKKGSQDAHEAIRPTDVRRHPDQLANFLNREQLRLYTLIWQKFVSAQMANEVSDQTTILVENGHYLFSQTITVQKFPGFCAVFPDDEKKKKERNPPQLSKGDALTLLKTRPEQHFTQPPPRFNDATIVKILEESGVGRPSTYAPTIATLLKRFYAQRSGRQLKPTVLGRLVNKIITENFPELVDINFTAGMEKNLDAVEEQQQDWRTFIDTFYRPFSATVRQAMEQVAEMKTSLDVSTEYICQKCGRNMVKRIGRYGYFLACPGFPECRNAKPVPIADCPVCEKGHLVQRATKRGRAFFGCDSYPECEFSTWEKPLEERKCPNCGKILFEISSKEKGKHIACLNPACKYEEAIDKNPVAAG